MTKPKFSSKTSQPLTEFLKQLKLHLDSTPLVLFRNKGIYMQDDFDKFIEEFIKKSAASGEPKTPY